MPGCAVFTLIQPVGGDTQPGPQKIPARQDLAEQVQGQQIQAQQAQAEQAPAGRQVNHHRHISWNERERRERRLEMRRPKTRPVMTTPARLQGADYDW
jgi:alkylated DNA repair dioxygenase AlkB